MIRFSEGFFLAASVTSLRNRGFHVDYLGHAQYCGLYCAYGALRAIGKDVPFETLLRPRYMSSRQGSSIAELRQAVLDAGSHAVALAGLGADRLRDARHPMILHVASEGQLKGYNHWVLFCGMQGGEARLLDAPNPIELVSLADVLARWDGTALVVSDEPSGARSIAVGEGIAGLGVILSTLLLLYLVDFGIRRWRSARTSEAPRWARASNVLGQSVTLLGCSLVVGVGLHVIDEDGLLRNPAATRYVAAANISHFFPKFTDDDARRFLREGRGVVIDARYPESFQKGHLSGAINVPVDASPTVRRERLRGVAPRTRLLVYCQSIGCEYDEYLAALLARDGFESISLYPGGWMEWVEHEHADRSK